jgi:hypothetical protein
VSQPTPSASEVRPGPEEPSETRSDRFPIRPQWLLVTAAVLFNYWFLRAEVLPVSYLNDSSVHEQMVRFATSRLQGGHLPQTSWFPYLGLGSPQFLHYQSLPSTLAGLVGMLIGPQRAFAWSLYLLLSLWPVTVYLGVRAFRFDRWTAASAAALSPFIVSTIGVGFEARAYLWTGFGLWTQLWAMLVLPLAWGYCWRAISEGRSYLAAIAFASLTVMLHFETGYLAVIPIALFPFLTPSALKVRIKRALLLAGGTLVATAWVTVPLLLSARWASINEILSGTALENGYGARRVLGWIVSGQLLDAGRFPVLTLLAGVGLVLCTARFGRDERARALIVLLIITTLLSFGRTTFGPLVDVIPGSTDIFMRRFMSGMQLAGLCLVGVGATAMGSTMVAVVTGRVRRRDTGSRTGPAWVQRSIPAIGVVIAVAVLAPAWSQVAHIDRSNAEAVNDQRAADANQGAAIAPIIQRIRRFPDGRVYAGSPNNWGAHFTVGAVPVFKYLENEDVDEVGYTLRTASLMTDPEYYFDESNRGDYTLFGVRYILTPQGRPPPVPATLAMLRSPYALWELPTTGYSFIARPVGSLDATRADIGSVSVHYLRSSLPGEGKALLVNYDGSGAPARGPTRRSAPSVGQGGGGVVLSTDADLANGSARVAVRIRQPSLVVLSASFDPGWTVSVDGKPAATVMVAPALVGVSVPPGAHVVVFRYRGFAGYPALIVLSLGVLAAALAYQLVWRQKERRGNAWTDVQEG